MRMSRKMSWKSLGAFVAVIGFCCIGLAAQNDPFLGIWALNVDQTSNYPMKSQLIINVPSPDSPDAFISMRASINKNGQSSTEIHPVVFDGNPTRLTEATLERSHTNASMQAQWKEPRIGPGKSLSIRNKCPKMVKR